MKKVFIHFILNNLNCFKMAHTLSALVLEDPLECSLCRKKYNTVKKYFIHLDLQHPPQNLYNCVLCPGDKPTLKKYRRHLLGHIRSIKSCPLSNPIEIDENPTINNLEQNLNEDVHMNNPDLDPIFNEDAQINDSQNQIISNKDQQILNKVKKIVKECKDLCLNNLIQLCSYSDISFNRAFQIVSQKVVEHTKMVNMFIMLLDSKSNEINEELSELKNIYSSFESKYLFLKHLCEIDIYSEPFIYIVGDEIRLLNQLGINRLTTVNDTVCHLNIKFMMKKLFELPNFYKMMLNKLNFYLSLNDGKLRNFVQGNIWKKIVEQNPNKIIFPYFIYMDDIEIASQVGHNVSKQALCIYTIHFPVLDDFLQAKTEFMFPICIAKTSDTKKYAKDYILGPLIREHLDSLARDGIEIEIDGEIKKIYLILGLVTGDNKAVNELLGYTGSFIHNYCCRCCLMERKDRDKAVEENPQLIRKKYQYEEHCETREFGLNRYCLLNELEEFHVYRNSYADIFHDTIYSVIKEGLEAVIQDGLHKKKFSVEDLKRQFNIFDYGQIDSKNRLDDSIFDSKGRLQLTGKEWTLFLKYFTFVLGHYYIDNENQIILKYVHILEDLYNICNADVFDEDKILKLKQIITNHHQYYLDHIPLHKVVQENGKSITKILKQHLKYKQHNHLHYHNYIRDSGPLKFLSTMRLESHLREIKKCATTSNNRINIPLTIGKRYALKFSLFLRKYSEIDFSPISMGPKLNQFKLNDKYYKNNLHYTQIALNSNISSYKHVNYKGTMYRSDDTQFLLKLDSLNNAFKIIDIICPESIEDKNIYLVVERFSISYFDSHYHAYILGNSQDYFGVYKIDQFTLPFNVATLPNRQKAFKVNQYNFE